MLNELSLPFCVGVENGGGDADCCVIAGQTVLSRTLRVNCNSSA